MEMNEIYKLKRIKTALISGDVEASYNFIQDIKEFQKKIENHTLYDIALVLDGHTSSHCFMFSWDLFYKWCKNNNIEYYHVDIDKIIKLKRKIWK
jgi:hypothetical protein